MFGKDFTLCLIMSPFQLDPILSGGAGVKVSSALSSALIIFSDNCALQVSVYGQGSRYGSRPLAQMKLQYCEGHVLGQVYSAVRGYVWRDKVTLPLLSIMNTMV